MPKSNYKLLKDKTSKDSLVTKITIKKLYNLLNNHYKPGEWWPSRFKDKYKKAIEISIGALLTQNTNWSNVEKALNSLYYKTKFDIDSILNIEIKELKEIIKTAGYYNQKAEALIELLKFLKYNMENLFKDNIFALEKDLLEIKRIGKETADSILLYGFNRPIFVIDAYTRRLFYRLGLINNINIDYDHIRIMVEKSFKDHDERTQVKIFKEFHGAIVEHGKKLCKKSPLCKKGIKCFLARYCLYSKDKEH